MNGTKTLLFNVFNLALFLIWILNGGSVLSVMSKLSLFLLLLGFVITLLISFGVSIKRKVVTSYLFSLFILTTFLFINYFFSQKPQDISKYSYICLQFISQGLFCVYVFSVFTYNKFQEFFYRILVFVKWHALISAVIVTLAPALFSLKIQNEFSGFEGKSFMYLFYLRSDQYSFSLFGLPFTRNQGLFWEPGVLQFYLNILLVFQLYIFKVKRVHIVITVIAILTTYSTTAFGLMAIVLSSFLYQQGKKKPAIIIPVFTIAALLFLPLFQSNLENKLSGDKKTSSMVRIYDLVQQVYVVKDNFITGVGLDDQRYQVIRAKYGLPEAWQQLLGYNQLERGSSNSILFILATMGVFMGGILIYAFSRQMFIKEKPRLVLFLLIVSVMSEPLLLKPFFITFIFSGLMYMIVRRKADLLWRKDDNTAFNNLADEVEAPHPILGVQIK